MDPLLTMMIVVAVLLGVALVILVLVVARVVRSQGRKSKPQGARRAVERERRELLLGLKGARPASGPEKATPDLDESDVDEDLEIEEVTAEVTATDDELVAMLRQERESLRQHEVSLDRREERLATWENQLKEDRQAVDHKLGALDQARSDVEKRRSTVAELENVQRQELARIAQLSIEDARDEVLAKAEHEARLNATQLAREIETEARRTGEAKARAIIVNAIQRLASIETTESVVSTVPLPGDDMKGRIIGREGRNIRAFEQITGVNVMIDDTPETVLLSCFDPVRRETARLTLAELVQDGRIHPARIEEVFERNKDKIADLCVRAAEDALADVGISDLNPGLVPILGSLRYRTSYGQNVLKHLIETAHIAGLMAAELGLDIAFCRRAAFLHDIGKAITHEVEGSHARVGADLARRYGEHADIVHAIEAHHNEVEPRTVEAVLTQAADAISGGRPGARRESLEVYIQRLQRLEEIARAHHGVDRVFAMQAGREVRVMVSPDQVGDAEAHAMARDIAHQIEEELTYPGNIKVTVVRESRAIELAH